MHHLALNLSTSVVLILILAIQISQIHTATSVQSSHPHSHNRHRHKHHQILTIDSNQIHDIREAFADYRKTIGHKVDFDELKPLRHHKHHHKKHNQHERNDENNSQHEDETMPAIHQHQRHGQHSMNRHKRLNGGKAATTTTTTTTSTTTAKTIDNYDEEYDDEESDAGNRRVSDDAQVQARSSQVETSNQLSNGESLTSYKMNNLGTREGVERGFQDMRKNNENDLWSHVFQNLRRTKTEGLCRWPNKKVVEAPHHPSKTYMPRKYVIYHCSDDTSCCGSTDKTCVAKKYDELIIYFHVRYFNQTDDFEPLRVKNHTECECIYRNQQRTRPIPSASFWTSTLRTPLQFTTTTMTATTGKSACKCPQTYESVFSNDGNCECRCERGGAECRLKYEGKEGFTMSDQRCIKSRDCLQPLCLYGTYQMNQGRCPDRNDKLSRGFSRQNHQQQQQRL